jgi:hypothetical protein
LVFDGIGVASLILASGFTEEEGLSAAGLNCVCVAAMSLTLGGIVGTISYSSRHGALGSAGYDPPGGVQTTSWALTALTAASFTTAVVLAMVSEDIEDTPSAIDLEGGAAAASIAAILFEGANLAVREVWWSRALESAPSAIASKPAVEIAPAVGLTRPRRDAPPTPTLGLAGRF